MYGDFHQSYWAAIKRNSDVIDDFSIFYGYVAILRSQVALEFVNESIRLGCNEKIVDVNTCTPASLYLLNTYFFVRVLREAQLL